MVNWWVVIISVMAYSISVVWSIMVGGFFWLWVYMEVMLVFILVLMSYWGSSISSVLEYYIYQVSASLLMMFGWLVHSSVFFVMSFIIKLGLFPFHVYMVKVVSGLNSVMYGFILVLQKIVPLYILFEVVSQYGSIEGCLLLSSLLTISVGVMGGLVGKVLGHYVAYSSLVHSGWMIILMMVSLEGFIYFMLLYISFYLLMIGADSASSVDFKGSVMLMVVSGFPPLMGFAMKVKLIAVSSVSYSLLVGVVILLSSVSFLYYVRMMVLNIISCEGVYEMSWVFLIVVMSFVVGLVMIMVV